MDHVRELDRIANKERGEVIADQVPVTFGGIELGGEAPWVTQGFRGVVAMHHSREAHEHRCGFTGGEYFGLGQVAEVVGHGEGAMGARAACVHHALRNAFAVEALQLLDQLHILQQHRAIGAGGLGVLVITDVGPVIAGQVGGLHREGKQAGGHQCQRMARRHGPAADWSVHRGFLWFFLMHIQLCLPEASDLRVRR